MSTELTNVTNVTIDILYVYGGVVTFVTILGGVISSYWFFVVKSINEKIVTTDEKIVEVKKNFNRALLSIEKTLIHYRDVHDEHAECIKDLEILLSVTKVKLDGLDITIRDRK